MKANRVWQCHYCKTSLLLDTLKKNRLCPTCGSDLHSCRNCTHFNESISSKCREPQSEWISDRSAQNDCAFFEMRSAKPGESQESTSSDMLSEAERAKEAFKALFRNLP